MGVCSINQRVRWVFVTGVFGTVLFMGAVRPDAAACGGAPSVSTDKPDYGPTETVMIAGSGFGMRCATGRRRQSARWEHMVG